MSGICAATDIDPRLLERLNCPLEEIAKLCEKFQVIELSVFGSAVRDDFKPESSDIDFLYLMHPDAEIGVYEFTEFHDLLSDLLKRELDLVPKKWMGERFEKRVLPEAQVIYAA